MVVRGPSLLHEESRERGCRRAHPVNLSTTLRDTDDADVKKVLVLLLVSDECPGRNDAVGAAPAPTPRPLTFPWKRRH